MKRKLDENDVPTVEATEDNATALKPIPASFQSLNLDTRILQAVAKSQFAEPTPVQAEAIPLALEGKDIIAKSRTGTGKTAAYVLPIIQTLLQRKQNKSRKEIYALVLVPTRELADQVTKAFISFAAFCPKDARALNLTQRISDAVLNAKLQELPDVIVSTPGRVGQLIGSGGLELQTVGKLVIDEADLVLSYGYEDDMALISTALPKSIQSFLLSATMTPEVEQLSSTFCRNPATINITSADNEKQSLTQYVVKCGEEEKFLLIYVIFKLKLVKGKTIIFVADTDRCYRLKLYLEQFGIRSCVLNSELPVNSRLHVVEEFNKGLYDIMIAADDQEVIDGIHRSPKHTITTNELEEDDAHFTDEDAEDRSTKGLNPEKLYRKDFGVSRGIDFQNVSCVLNFDLPRTSKAYTHRIGRTARAGQSGIAFSFVVPRSEYKKHIYTSIPQSKHDERVLEKIVARQSKKGNELTPHQFESKQVEAFRYRMNDALRAVTRTAVREARAREIKQELVRSEKLRKHFEDNPEDLRHLKSSGGEGGIVRVQSHMKHVPEYLLPGGKQEAKDVGFVGLNGDERSKKRRKTGNGKKRKFSKKRVGRRNDPLKSFKSGRK